MDPRKHRVELVVTVDKDGFHGRSDGSFRAPRWREV
jgi:hypothetical protein